MQVDGSLVTLDSSVKYFDSVGLSKSQTGVTAKMDVMSGLLTVFFDGNTAQLQVKGTSRNINAPSRMESLNYMFSFSELLFSSSLNVHTLTHILS